MWFYSSLSFIGLTPWKPFDINRHLFEIRIDQWYVQEIVIFLDLRNKKAVGSANNVDKYLRNNKPTVKEMILIGQLQELRDITRYYRERKRNTDFSDEDTLFRSIWCRCMMHSVGSCKRFLHVQPGANVINFNLWQFEKAGTFRIEIYFFSKTV